MGSFLSFLKFTRMKEEEDEEPYVTWMTDSLHILGNRRLNQIAIPGTHNSATHSFTRASRYSVDQPGLLKVGYQNGEFYTCHGMTGDTIRDILYTFIEFANIHPREVVIIDLNHFYNMADQEHELLARQMHDLLADKLWPFHHADATLDEAHNMHLGPIVVVYHRPQGHKYSFYPNSAITAPWHNTDDMAELQERLQQSLIQFDRGSKQLFVSQCILTPKVDTALRGFWKCNWSLFGIANKLNQEVVEWIARFHQARPLNIVLVDHYHTCNFVDLVVKLNFSPT